MTAMFLDQSERLQISFNDQLEINVEDISTNSG